MGSTKPKYEIREDRFDSNWDEETVVLYTGGMEEQMKNLFYGVKDRRGAKSIRLYLVNKEGKTIASTDESD